MKITVAKITVAVSLLVAALVTASPTVNAQLIRVAADDNAALDDIQSMRTYVDRENRYSAVLLPGWRLVEPSSGIDGVYFVRDPSEVQQIGAASVAIIVTPMSDSLVELANSARDYFERQPGVSDWQPISERLVDITGAAGIERVDSVIVNEAELVIQSLYVHPPDGVLDISISFTSTKEDRPRLLPEINRMINNFKTL